jgi:putative membrane protein
MGLGWLIRLAVIFAVVVLTVYTARLPLLPAKKSAEEILKERFARGEISKEEYAERLTTLRNN